MSEEIEVSVGDDVVTDVPVDEVKPEEGKTDALTAFLAPIVET